MAEFPSLFSHQLSELLQSFGDRKLNFVNSSDADRFYCPIHKGLLLDPCQTECGHRLCSKCIDTYLAGAPSKRCPVGEQDCTEIARDKVRLDNSLVREMKEAMIFCTNKEAGCSAKLTLQTIETHLLECEFEAIPCTYIARGCQEKVMRGKLDQHKNTCPYRPQTCPSCSQEVSHNQMEEHNREQCPETVTGCPYDCGEKKLKRKEDGVSEHWQSIRATPHQSGPSQGGDSQSMPQSPCMIPMQQQGPEVHIVDHRNSCPTQPMDCKFKHMGCRYTNKRELVKKHEKEELAKHLELVTVSTAKLQVDNLEVQNQIQKLRTESDELQRNLLSSQTQDNGVQAALDQLKTQLTDTTLRLVMAVEKIHRVEGKMSEMAERSQVAAIEQALVEIRQKITQLEQVRERDQQQQSGSGSSRGTEIAAVNTSLGQFTSVESMANTFSTQLTKHDTQLSVHDIRLAEMDLRFQLLETAAYDGTLIWKIREYSHRKSDAVNGRTLSLFSQPFYSSRFGYKMCARVYLNGDGMGKGSHLSLFLVIMRGEYDPLLVWPFRMKITLTLLDQSLERRHLSDHFQPDPNSASFQRPTSEMNVASGCPLFVSQNTLEDQSKGYLKDNTVFLRIVVDTNTNTQNF